MKICCFGQLAIEAPLGKESFYGREISKFDAAKLHLDPLDIWDANILLISVRDDKISKTVSEEKICSD